MYKAHHWALHHMCFQNKYDLFEVSFCAFIKRSVAVDKMQDDHCIHKVLRFWYGPVLMFFSYEIN